MTTAAVTVAHLSVQFGQFFAVRDVSFNVQPGEIFGFLGANGAGKTTTIRVLCGLLVPTAGEVSIDGVLCIAGNEQMIKQKVGYMSQRFTLYGDLTVDENLNFAASLRNLPRKILKQRKEELLHFIDFDKKLNVIVNALPGGQKQEVALIAALLHDPQIIFLDEPTAGVAPVARARFWDLIKQLSQRGKTVFVTTHYMDEAENCHRIALMRSGELIALDTPQNLKTTVYQQQIYHVTAHDKAGHARLIAYAREHFTMFEPYGQHYHVMVKDQHHERQVMRKAAEFCQVKKIAPSLEDVFVKLVEGDQR